MVNPQSAHCTLPSARLSAPILIIGIGNTLRGDDGIGIAAAELLEQSLSQGAAHVIATHQLLPELAEPISRCEQVIFIDADATLAAGTHRSVKLLPADSSDKTIGHHQSPAGLLRMAGDLYGHCPSAVLYSIGGENFGYKTELSALSTKTVRAVVARIIEGILQPRQRVFG